MSHLVTSSTIPVTLFERAYLCKTLSLFKGSEPTRLLRSRFEALIPQLTGCTMLHIEVEGWTVTEKGYVGVQKVPVESEMLIRLLEMFPLCVVTWHLYDRTPPHFSSIWFPYCRLSTNKHNFGLDYTAFMSNSFSFKVIFKLFFKIFSTAITPEYTNFVFNLVEDHGFVEAKKGTLVWDISFFHKIIFYGKIFG